MKIDKRFKKQILKKKKSKEFIKKEQLRSEHIDLIVFAGLMSMFVRSPRYKKFLSSCNKDMECKK